MTREQELLKQTRELLLLIVNSTEKPIVFHQAIGKAGKLVASIDEALEDITIVSCPNRTR